MNNTESSQAELERPSNRLQFCSHVGWLVHDNRKLTVGGVQLNFKLQMYRGFGSFSSLIQPIAQRFIQEPTNGRQLTLFSWNIYIQLLLAAALMYCVQHCEEHATRAKQEATLLATRKGHLESCNKSFNKSPDRSGSRRKRIANSSSNLDWHQSAADGSTFGWHTSNRNMNC